MQSDDLFPIEAFSDRVKTAILDEFSGRCPTVREVARIPDSRWLSAPSIGPVVLQKIRSVTHGKQSRVAAASGRLTDAELLARLDELYQELRWIRTALEERLS